MNINLELIKQSGLPTLTQQQLNNLSTKRLLQIYKKMHGFNFGGYCTCGCKQSTISVRGTQEEKDLKEKIDTEIQKYKSLIKSLLNNREHILKK